MVKTYRRCPEKKTHILLQTLSTEFTGKKQRDEYISNSEQNTATAAVEVKESGGKIKERVQLLT